MLGDVEWRVGLWHAYQQHLADSMRLSRPSAAFDVWAVERTWDEFETLARFVQSLPAFALRDWATENPVGSSGSGSFNSRILARRVFSGLVLVSQLLRDMQQADRPAWLACVRHINRGKGRCRNVEGMARGRRFVYEWLFRAAEHELQQTKQLLKR